MTTHRANTISKKNKPLASLVSLGCAKNLVDSETMVPQILAHGYQMTEHPTQASLIVVNTCGFLESAVEEAIQHVLEMGRLKESASCEKLVVTGCMVQRYGKKLLSLLPEVDLFLGTSHYHRLGEILLASRDGDSKKLWISRPLSLATSQSPRMRSTSSFSAYLKIADGCSNHCTYCMIPHLRGPYRSRTVEDALEEASLLAAEGVKEINLIAQDTTAFGWDRKNEGELISLLESLDTLEGVEWIRLLYVYPDRVTPHLLRTMAQAKKIVPYLDIPFQHCVPRILNAMRRDGSQVDAERLIDAMRRHIPNLALRTSLMVGFPGESAGDFRRLLQFVEETQFDHVGVFAFSPEAGTRAAKMPFQVPQDIKEERRHTLLELQRGISRQRLQNFVDRELPMLIEGFHPETNLLLSGRLAVQAPEVDGSVIITAGEAEPGEIVPARITVAHDYDLEAEILPFSG